MRSATYPLSISAARADVLFASALRWSDEPSGAQVHQAIAAAVVLIQRWHSARRLRAVLASAAPRRPRRLRNSTGRLAAAEIWLLDTCAAPTAAR